MTLLFVAIMTTIGASLWYERDYVLGEVHWVSEHRKQWEKIEPLIQDLARQARSARGRASIDDAPSTEPYVRININSDAAKFFVLHPGRTSFRIRAVNLSHPLKVDTTLRVVGSYDEPEGKTIARLNRAAARALEAEGREDITVFLEYINGHGEP